MYKIWIHKKNSSGKKILLKRAQTHEKLNYGRHPVEFFLYLTQKSKSEQFSCHILVHKLFLRGFLLKKMDPLNQLDPPKVGILGRLRWNRPTTWRVDLVLASWPQVRGPSKIDPSNRPATWHQIPMIEVNMIFFWIKKIVNYSNRSNGTTTIVGILSKACTVRKWKIVFTIQ